jgi:deazaflavin-dependent oxidoreductase (nitroreductase family)
MSAQEDPQFCYVTTRGRVTRRQHQIEIWFAREPDARTIYLLSGGRDRSDWVRNIRADGGVTVRIGDTTFDGIGRVVDPDTDEDALARRLLEEKYGHTMDLTRWLRESLPVAIHLS